MKAIFFAVGALLNGGRLSCAGLGRAVRRKVKPKHNIKRIDRLMSNNKLHQELRLFFHAITQTVIGKDSRPIILIDWTKIEYGKFSAMTAAVPIDGRAIPILWSVEEGFPMVIVGWREKKYLEWPRTSRRILAYVKLPIKILLSTV
jgi:hypothetical protein